MKIFFIIFLLYLFNYQAIIAQKEANPSIWYLRDANANFTVDSLLKKTTGFTMITNTVQSFGTDAAPYWFRVSVNNESPKTLRKLVEVGNAYLDEVTFFVVEDGKLTYKSPTISWQTPYEKRLIKHYNPIFPIDIAPQSKQIFYLRVYLHIRALTVPIKVWDEGQFYENEINQKFFWGGYGGILVFAFILGLILFVALRQRTYLYYALYVLAALFFNFMNKGLFLQYYQNGFLGITGTHVRQMFLNLEITFILLFIKEYLFPNFRFSFILNSLFKLSITLNLIAILLLCVEKKFGSNYPTLAFYLSFLYTVAFLFPVLFSFYLVFYNIINKIEVLASSIYLIGVTPLVILSIISTFRNFDMIPNHWLLEIEGIMMLFLFEILVLSIGLGIRYKKLRDEKEQQQRLVYEGKLKLLHERENISRDLHDNVGSQLSVIASNLDNIGFLAEKQKLTPEKVETVNEFVREAIQSLRDTIWATHQETFSLAEFRARVQQYIHKFYQSETCQISVNFDENDRNLNSSQILNLFRIIQEALNNAIKYAQASHISINVKIFEKQIMLSIIDNGIGFDVESKKAEPHFGLLNMQKRVNEMDGKLEIQSKLGEGTKIEVSV
ncbi:7TM-DISM domain-containing protein [Emticicia sp.]|uniref:sensor histidine kinase n=1 Tax=Emticicia sp. TaxID=1930953 RepID=UPI003751C8D3